jgi:hypothetical protein
MGNTVPHAAIASAGTVSAGGEEAAEAAPVVTNAMRLLATPMTESGLHPMSIAMRRQAIR